MLRRILITGAAGLIGSILGRMLSERYEVTLLDRVPVDSGHPARKSLVVDMTDAAAAERAFRGHDAVIDLAAEASAELPWERVWQNNIVATRNALEAAARAGVRRFVFASSNYVTGGYESQQPYRDVLAGRYEGVDPDALPRLAADSAARPDCAYAIGKAFGEAACRHYSDFRQLPSICLRIGTVNATGSPVKPHHFSKLLSHRDLVQLVDRCVNAPDSLRFATYYGVSGNTWRIWDIERCAEEIGYRPEDDAESWRDPGAAR